MDALTTPSNWQKVRLGDMTTSFTKQTGFDYSASIKPTLIKEQLPHYIPFIQNKDFLGHYINYKTDYFIPNEVAIRFPQILLNEKCLLISIVGSIGNVAVFNHSQDAFTGCAIAVLKFKEKKSLDFVMHFLMSASGQKSLLNIVKASSHKSIILADLRDLLIPLPPLNEQIAIANVLSGLDRYLYSLDALILKKESVKKALSFELLSQRKRLKGFNQNWQKVRLGDIAEIKRGASPRPIENPKWFCANSNVGWVRISDISKNSRFLYKTAQKLSKKGIEKSRLVKQNSLIMSMCATIGKPIITKIDTCIHDGFVVFENPKIDLNYLYYFLCYIEKEWLESGQQGSQVNLNVDLIKNKEVFCPKDLNEQAAIANILSDLDNEIISLKNKKRQFENIKKALNHDLMSAKIRVLKK
ncbi:type I R-M system specificity subunit [Helicobacter pylori Hp H-11]|uniref:restriction endonuclease subunit S n=1 Tax=Helicobacter pylori TaxID=210 RepID=UPI00026AEAE4|nr:restriction endonuclease subunit S [Helicobacter pylori]EJB87515.1 type I R-M system specificity subunit [Helicobacter pylori Hp H-11]